MSMGQSPVFSCRAIDELHAIRKDDPTYLPCQFPHGNEVANRETKTHNCARNQGIRQKESVETRVYIYRKFAQEVVDRVWTLFKFSGLVLQ